jgi:hypothetical protein
MASIAEALISPPMAAHHRDRHVSLHTAHRNSCCQRMRSSPYQPPHSPCWLLTGCVFASLVAASASSSFPAECLHFQPPPFHDSSITTAAWLLPSRLAPSDGLWASSLRMSRMHLCTKSLFAKHGPSETLNLRHVLSHHAPIRGDHCQ